jgi:ABC-type sugar transport system ATPase subunit
MGLTILSSIEASQAFGESWAAELTGGEIIALHGVLGAGKTQLVKGLARGSSTSISVGGCRFTTSTFTASAARRRRSTSASRNIFRATASPSSNGPTAFLRSCRRKRATGNFRS